MNPQKDTLEIRRLLRDEEYRAERIISIARVVLCGIFFLESLTLGHFQGNRQYLMLVAPSFIIFMVSILMMLDMILLGSKRHYKAYNSFTKYVIITIDTGIASIVLHLLRKAEIIDFSNEWVIPFYFTVVGSFLLVLTIFRHRPYSCIYSGVVSLAAFIVTSEVFNNYDSWSEFLILDGQFQLANAMVFWAVISLTILSALISVWIGRILLKTKRQRQLERFLPGTVAREVLAGKRDLSSTGNRQRATILFSDIRNFTSMAEKMKPEEVIEFLNSYYNDMINIIFEYSGALDKIMGDGLMAVFGYPVSSGKDAEDAVQTAIGMQKKLVGFNEERKERNLEPIRIGVGIHTGDVIMGSVGSESRMDFTAIGDTVNTASRLEGLTKELGAPIIISDETRKNLNDNFITEELDTIKIRGRSESVEIYRVVI